MNYSVPVLYCVAFTGDLYRFPFVKRSMFVIAAPSVMYIFSLLFGRIFKSGLIETFEFFADPDTLKKMVFCLLYAAWALLLMFVLNIIYREIKKRARLKKVLAKYAPAALAVMLVAAAFAVLPLFESEDAEFVKYYDEKSDRYEFSYKNNGLYIRKEIFDKYELTEAHIQKFFDGAETVYKKLAGFYPKYDSPGNFTYHAVPEIWDIESGYEYYADKIGPGAWHDLWTSEIFYEENLFARHLSAIDIGFPSAACREIGYFFTMYAERRYIEHHARPYVWDPELFAVLSEYYIASEMPVINAKGEIITGGAEWEDPYYGRFFGWADKYGYKTISEILKKVNNASPDIDIAQKHPLTLFMDFLSKKTGDYISAASMYLYPFSAMNFLRAGKSSPSSVSNITSVSRSSSWFTQISRRVSGAIVV